MVVDKAHGVLSTPGRTGEEDGRPCLGLELQNQLKTQIFPVHRLDFEVSGLVVYAKNSEAHRVANSWFEHKQVAKTYRALSTGPTFEHIPPNVSNPRILIHPLREQKFEWQSCLLRGKRRTFESPHGKESVTLATYLEKNSSNFHVWDLNPVTGRSHQLRYELSHRGFPIVGDKLYGSKIAVAPDSLALRAYRIDFSKAPSASSLGLPLELNLDPALSI